MSAHLCSVLVDSECSDAFAVLLNDRIIDCIFDVRILYIIVIFIYSMHEMWFISLFQYILI
jgi:hypothetical protein